MTAHVVVTEMGKSRQMFKQRYANVRVTEMCVHRSASDVEPPCKNFLHLCSR